MSQSVLQESTGCVVGRAVQFSSGDLTITHHTNRPGNVNWEVPRILCSSEQLFDRCLGVLQLGRKFPKGKSWKTTSLEVYYFSSNSSGSVVVVVVIKKQRCHTLSFHILQNDLPPLISTANMRRALSILYISTVGLWLWGRRQLRGTWSRDQRKGFFEQSMHAVIHTWLDMGMGCMHHRYGSHT